MDLILPADQAASAIKKLKTSAKRVAKRSASRAALRADAADRIRTTNSVGGASSRSLTRKGARRLARQGGSEWRKEARLSEMLGTATAHFKSGAFASGILTGLEEAYGVFAKNGCPKKAAVNVISATASGGAQSVATSALSMGVKKAAKKVGAKALMKGNGAAAIAGGALDIAKHGYSYANGNIEGQEFFKEAGKTVVKGGATYAAGELGAIAGFAVGGPVGALVVGTLAAVASGYGLDSLFG